MNAKELRIGNWLHSALTNTDFQVNPDDIRNIWLNNDGGMVKHIPLTEKWLLKFGFEIKEKNYSLNVGGELFRYAIKDSFIIWKTHRNLWQFYEFTNNYTQYEYVHQLQNLYFALTTEELTCASQQINKSTNQQINS